MPELRWLALGAWVAALLGLTYCAGLLTLATALLLGAVPALGLAALFADDLTPMTGLCSKSAIEAAVKEVQSLEMPLSGGESMDWLNCLVEQLWPHITKYVEELIVSYESTIQGYLPRGAPTIRFKTCSFGKEHLKFGPVKAHIVDSWLDGQFLEDNGLELEIGVSYNSDVDIVLSTSIASVGIADLSISGVLSIVLRPLVSQSPFIGGMEVLFTNPPEIELDFRGAANFADVPGAYGAVRRAINGAIGGIMVSPNRKAFVISDHPGIDLARLRHPHPEGMLRMTVVKAENLEANDMHFDMTRSSDPYVEVQIGAEKWRTPTIQKTCNPVWTEGNVHDFLVFSFRQDVRIDVFDEDHFRDDSLGRVAQCSVAEVLRQATDTSPFPLVQRSKRDNEPPAGARLHFKCSWLNLVDVTGGMELENGPHEYILSLKIDECTGLPQAGLRAPFTIRLSLKSNPASALTTERGWPLWTKPVAPASVRRMLKLVKEGTATAAVADVMGVDEGVVKALLAASLPLDASDDECQEWCKRLHDSASGREMSSNPQFEEVLRLLSATRDAVAVVELLDSSREPTVVGHFEVQVGERAVVDGPWVIQDPATGAPLSATQGDVAKLHGTMHLYACIPSCVHAGRASRAHTQRFVGHAWGCNYFCGCMGRVGK